jgi:hypothetical protein
MALPVFLWACTSLLEYIFLISNEHGFIRNNLFWTMTTINCTVFCIINTYKRKFKLEDTKNYPTSERVYHSNDQQYKTTSLHILVKKIDLYLKYLEVTIWKQRSKNRSPYKNTYAQNKQLLINRQKWNFLIKLSRLYGMLHWTEGT